MAQRLPLIIYDAALMATGYSNGSVSPYSKNVVRRFLEETPAEDEWIERECFINGSPALLMRSMLHEQGSVEEKKAEEKLPEVRKALKAFLEGTPIPESLRGEVAMSIRYWKKVASWQDTVGRAVAVIDPRQVSVS